MPSFDIGHRLALYGYKGEPEDFFFILSDLWWVMRTCAQKHSNIEQFLYHPIDVLIYCEEVRAKAQVPVPDNEILQTLNNLRKNKFLATHKVQ